MRKQILCFISLLLIASHFACRDKQQSENLSHQLTVVEAKGYTVSADSIIPPTVNPVAESDFAITAATGLKPIQAHTNIYQAVQKKPVPAGTPVVCVPGKDSFDLPVVSAIIDSVIIAKPSNVVVAKDMAIKDPNPANFTYFGKLQGLTHNSISSLLQDKAGNIWIGTRGGGLTRYDGQNFTHFAHIPALASNRVNSLFEDRAGNMWFGSEKAGVFKYDGKQFMYFTDEKKQLAGFLTKILEDRSGNIWFASRKGGISKYDGKHFTHYTTRQGLSSNIVNAMSEDKQGNLWIGTKGGGLNKFDGKVFSRYTTKEGLPENTIQGLLEDRMGNLWVSTDSSGIAKFDGNAFHHFTINEGLSSNSIGPLLEDKAGNIWLGTADKGVIKYDGEQFTHYTENEGFPSNTVICMLQDRASNIWFGNYGSLGKLSGLPFSHFTEKVGLLYNQNWSLLEDKSDNIWLGSFGGLCKYDGKQFVSFTKENGLPKKSTVRALTQDHLGNIWMGFGGGGFCKFDGKNFFYYEDKINVPGSSIQDVLEDSKGNMWFANAEHGLYKYDGKSITNYTTKQGLSSNWTNTLLEDKNGDIWIGTSDGGIIKYDGKNFTNYSSKTGFIHDAVWSGYEDSRGLLWFGSEAGVARYDGKYFTYFTEQEGMSSGYGFSITEDKEGNIWFGTRSGLNKLPKDKAIKSYRNTGSAKVDTADNKNLFKRLEYADGFLGMGGQSGKTVHTMSNGDIWACSNDRVTIFNSSSEFKDIEPPKARLTSIWLYNEPIDWKTLEENMDSSFLLANGVKVSDIQFDSIIKWHALPANLSLPYDNNYLTFNFIGITMYQPGRVKYRYMLEGNDKSWSGITANNRASYGNLSPGKYTLKVKAMDSNGQWSNEYTYSFAVRPPWWKTWWAYGLYILMAGGLLWSYIQFRSKALRRENLLLEKKVNHRTKQLQESIESLKATQSQLIQSEKMASLGELTAGIAHEIQNPLNFVNNFSEVSNELISELVDEVDKGNTGEVRIIAKDVQQNLEKILHHGKRADAIVKGMLQHSRSSNSQKEPTDINALADEYLRLAYHGLRARDKSFNANLKTDFDPSIGSINIIPQDIGRVILNLITNAFYVLNEKKKTSTPSEGGVPYEPTVSLSTRKSGQNIEIRVTDNGNGIPKKVLDKIFQPFFTTKPTGEGTGLGLSLSHDIVTKGHGGSIEVNSVEGEFTEFLILLPVKA